MQHLLALISMHACTIKKEYLWMKSACEHIPENCFKHLIVVYIDPAILIIVHVSF